MIDIVDLIIGFVLLYNVSLLGYDNNELISVIFKGKLYSLTIPKLFSTMLLLALTRQYVSIGYFCILYRLCLIRNA
jgi:hypothetical protein